MRKKRRPARHHSPHLYYRLLVTLAGGIVFLWILLRGPVTIDWGGSLLLASFIFVQVIFGLPVLNMEADLTHAISLGGGMLFGAPTAALGAAGGMLLGSAARAFAARKTENGARAEKPDYWNWFFEAGIQIIALGVAWWAMGSKVVFQSANPSQMFGEPSTRITVGILAFYIVHASLAVGKYWFAWQEQPGSRSDWWTLIAVELLPVPLLWFAVLSYPTVGVGALLVLGSVLALVQVLVFRIHRGRKDLARRMKELLTLQRVSDVLRSTLDLESLLGVIHLQVTELLGVDSFYVALYEPEDDSLWYPLAVKLGEHEHWPDRALEDRLTDRVIREGLPIRLNDLSPEQMAALNLPIGDGPPKAWIGVPLVSSERTIGCLALFSLDEETEFTQADQDLLSTLSGQISVAIENALLYRQTQRRTAQLEMLNQVGSLLSASLDPQEVLTQVCQSVTQVGGAGRSAIYLLDPDRAEVWLAYAHRLSDRFVGENRSFSVAKESRTQCLLTGRPDLKANIQSEGINRNFSASLSAEGITAYGDFPMVTPEGQIGFLSVYYDSPHPFTSDEIELLQTLASEAALAVSNARLYARTDLALSRRANQLSILEAVGRELAAATHSDRLFEMILNYAREYTNSEWGRLALYEEESQMMDVKATVGYQKVPNQIPVSQGLSGKAIRTRQMINQGDVRSDPDHLDLSEGQALSQLSIPLLHEGRVLGVLTLETSQQDGYSTNDQSFVAQLANQAAIAVINADLYQEVQQRLRQQTTLYQVSTRLAGNLDTASVVDVLYQSVTAVTDRPKAVGIYLWNEAESQYVLSKPSSQATQPILGGGNLPEMLSPNDLGELFPRLTEANLIELSVGMAIPIVLRRAMSGHALTILPLVASQQILGLVMFYHQGNYRASTERLSNEKRQFLLAITSQGAIALQNASLFADVSQGRDRLAAVLNSVREGIIMIGLSGQVILVNEAAQMLIDLPETRLIGTRLALLEENALARLGYTGQAVSLLVNSLGDETGDQEPVQHAHDRHTYKITGSEIERYFERMSLPVKGSFGQAIGWIIVLRDVTEEVRIAEAREMITETLVHDLRSPLSAVLGALDVMSENIQTENQSDVFPQAFQLARRSSRRVMGMVESLLDISRMQAGSMDLNRTSVNLPALVINILVDFTPQAQDYGVELVNTLPPDLPATWADQSKLSRILVNLLDNALKFTPAGGRIILSAELSPVDMLTVRISDTGPGIPVEFREKIFERFTQVPGQRGRRRGSGLGLTFCRLAVEAHGGKIWVESNPGGGSVFHFTLPVEPDG